MSDRRWVYQINGDSEIYSNRLRAHKRLCNMARKSEDDWLPYKEFRDGAKIIIQYPNGWHLVKRELL